MTEELKPCPYCESNRVAFEVSCGIMGHIICLNCTARGPLTMRAHAIEAWNKRAEPFGNSEELSEWLKDRIETDIKELKIWVESTFYPDLKYAGNLAIEHLQRVLSLRRQQ